MDDERMSEAVYMSVSERDRLWWRNRDEVKE